MIVKLLTEHHVEFLSLKGECRGSSESTLAKNVKLLEISCHGIIIKKYTDCRSFFGTLNSDTKVMLKII